jgi:hypothetical protein
LATKGQDPPESSHKSLTKKSKVSTTTGGALREESEVARPPDYRALQGDGFLVDTPYHQESAGVLHAFSFSRISRGNWAANSLEELTLGNQRHQFILSVPSELTGNAPSGNRGFGDTEIEYSYGLFGDSESSVTASPGFILSLPTGSVKKALGTGGTGITFKLPISIMLGSRFASNSAFEVTYTKSAKNEESEKANTVDYEFGQSFVWFAKPKLNFLIETVWANSQEIVGKGVVKNGREFLVSPAVRWTYLLKGGLSVSPSIAFPIGLGPSSGQNGVLFNIAFERSLGKAN